MSRMNESPIPDPVSSSNGALAEAPSEEILVSINGMEKRVSRTLTVEKLLQMLQLSGEGIAVALNDAIVVRSAHPMQSLQAGDRVEILHAVAGG